MNSKKLTKLEQPVFVSCAINELRKKDVFDTPETKIETTQSTIGFKRPC